ncbi:MAG: tRNA (N(6)-L-threonylcarbamoyladenosine(37)-C(2))-methylthiotransferase MtaB [Lachnospiraceae bacterium]
MKTIALHNLGCKVNSYEFDVMQQNLAESGFTIVPFDQKADIYLVNTCSVTNIADRKSRQMLHRARKRNPEAIVVAVGCYVQTGRETLKQDPDVDLAVGNNRKRDIVEILNRYMAERECVRESGYYAEDVVDMDHTCEYEEMQLRKTAEHTRAYIKIQDGCNQFCSYCIIPYARGRVRSRKPEDVVAEVRALAEAGYREIVVTGIHISSYGVDFEQPGINVGDYMANSGRLPELLLALDAVEGVSRIRISSLEPRIVTEKFTEQLRQMRKLCPHFHLSLQSGCDATLQRMNRHYTTADYARCVELLRTAFPKCAVTTDVIVGFPGETEEEFACTRAYLEKQNLYEMHVFKYSKRRGTVAAAMPNQLTEAQKGARSDVLLAMTERQSVEFRRRFIGEEVEILLEERKEIDGVWYRTGYSREYVPVAVREEEIATLADQWDDADNTRGRIVRGVGSELLADKGILFCEKIKL